MAQASENIATQYTSALMVNKVWGNIIVNVKSPPFNAKGDGVTDDTTAAKKAIQNAADNGGGEVRFPPGKYVISEELQIPSGVLLTGAGVGQWEPIFPDRPKTWEGTTLLFKGTGAKTRTFPGVTSMKYGGGWRVNPDNPAETFKLTSFHQSNASGATPATARAFAAAIGPKDDAMYWGVKDLRIVPWKGSDGYSAYSDKTNATLSDVWDIGILLLNTEYVRIENVQSVGEWREFAFLDITPGLTTDGRSEQNCVERCKFQGRVGMGFRSADRWAVTAKTSNSVSIYWSEESYWPSSGTFRGSDNTVYTYTGTTKAGTDLTFTGVTPDPNAAGIFQVRNPKGGTGFANLLVKDVYAYGFDHVNGGLAAAYGLSDSKPFEISGFPMRGITFTNFKAHSGEKVVAHIHDVSDPVFFDPQWEGGGFIIASPVTTDATYAAAPVGETRNIVMFGDHGTEENDLRLFIPRNGFVQGLQIAPRADLTGDFIITPLRDGKDLVLKGRNGRSVYIRNAAGADSVRVTDSGNVIVQNGGQFSLQGGTAYINADSTQNLQLRNGTTGRLTLLGASGNFSAGADNAQTFGTSGGRWSTIYAATGTINTSDEREKADIVDEPLGLEFIKKLQPKQFKFKDGGALDENGEQVPGVRPHHGLIAQQLKAVLDEMGIDHAAFVESPVTKTVEDEQGNIVEIDTGETRLGIRYEELLSSVIKAVQEIAVKVGL